MDGRIDMKESTEKSTAEYTHVVHTFEPVCDENSRILILGSFPSVKSRENRFYYGHPQNRFWKVTAGVFGEKVPESIDEKKRFLQKCRIAVWDVIASCDIIGSSDSSIKNVTANDMDVILRRADIGAIYANGETAYRLFLKYCIKEGQPDIHRLPSTSPANAAWSVDQLTEAWREAFREGGLL